MDNQFYWTIAERDIEIQNPITDRKLRLLDDYCDIRDGLRVLDIGCGKAWLLRQWAERFAIEGVGVDLNSRFLDVARRKPPARGTLTFHRGAGRRLLGAPRDFRHRHVPRREFRAGRVCLGDRVDGPRGQAGRRDRHRRPDAQASPQW